MDTILFVHDHRFYTDSESRFYSEGKLSFAAFEAYLTIAKKVHVVCRQAPKSPDVRIEDLALTSANNVVCLPVKGNTWKEILVRNFKSNVFFVGSSVRKADLVILRLPSILSLVVFPMLILFRKPYAVEVVGDGYEAIRRSGKYSRYAPLALFYDQCMKAMVKLAVGAIYVTERSLQEKYTPPKVCSYASNVTIAPVSTAVIEQRASKLKALAALPSGVVKVGIVGSFSNNYKGIDVLISSIFLVRKKFNVELFIVGSGDKGQFEGVIERYKAKDWVHFQGRFSKERLVEWYRDIDLYCQPSRTEGLPRALVEAMSQGCPALGTHVGGIPELLDEDCLVKVDDAAELAFKINWLLSDSILMQEKSRRNFYKAASYYSDVLEERRANFWQQVSFKVSKF